MTDEQSKAVVVSNLTEFFRDSVSEALKHQQLAVSQETEFYLVNLLESYSKAERLHGTDERDEPLALLLRRAIESNPDASIPLYRRIGDVSLYKSGFFSRNLRKAAVSPRYYREMGRGAYDVLSSMMGAKRDKVFAGIFAELAEKFGRFVEVFIEVSENHAFGASSEEPTDLLERWASAHSQRAGRRLVRDGMLPLWRFESSDEPSDGESN